MWWVLKIEQDYIQFPFWYVIKSTERGLFVNRPVCIIPSKFWNRIRLYSISFLVRDNKLLAVVVQNTMFTSLLTSNLWHFGAKLKYKVTTIVMERIASHEILIKERL